MVLLPFIGLIVFCGIYPKPMLDRIEPSVKVLLERVEERTGFAAPGVVHSDGHSDGHSGGESDDHSGHESHGEEGEG